MTRILQAFALFCLLGTGAIARELPDFTDLVDEQGPTVVNISTTSTRSGPPSAEEDPYDLFRRPPGQTPRDNDADPSVRAS
jgi:serine protease Do